MPQTAQHLMIPAVIVVNWVSLLLSQSYFVLQLKNLGKKSQYFQPTPTTFLILTTNHDFFFDFNKSVGWAAGVQILEISSDVPHIAYEFYIVHVCFKAHN